MGYSGVEAASEAAAVGTRLGMDRAGRDYDEGIKAYAAGR